jgi:hypothetical protein
MVKNNGRCNHVFFVFVSPLCFPCFPTIFQLGKHWGNICTKIALFRLVSSFVEISRNPLFIGISASFSAFTQIPKSDPDGVWYVAEGKIVGGLVGKRGE